MGPEDPDMDELLQIEMLEPAAHHGMASIFTYFI
jgi:hypothetical protein